MAVRTLIVEDEALARRSLRSLIEEVEWLELLGEAADGRTAVRLIDEGKPDLVFLDVQMPELSGLEVLEQIRHEPWVVFTTAHDRYAVAAFELEAIDYLVKPFGRRRFRETLDRVRRKIQEPPGEPVAERARQALGEGPLRRFLARQGDRIVPIPVETVCRLEACDDYVAVHSNGKTFLLHMTLAELEKRLDPERFRRVHRSHILNFDFVKQMQPYDDRRLLVTLKDGSQILASRSGSQRLRELIS